MVLQLDLDPMEQRLNRAFLRWLSKWIFEFVVQQQFEPGFQAAMPSPDTKWTGICPLNSMSSALIGFLPSDRMEISEV